MQDWIALVVSGVLALVALTLAVALWRARSRTDRELAVARAETSALRDQLDELARRIERPAPAPEPVEFVITGLSADVSEPDRPAPEVSPALFADLVLRETVVKAASLAHGVRRALDAETRNRIRFEMGREVKRARKQRRADTRQAVREWQARQRGAGSGTDEDSADPSHDVAPPGRFAPSAHGAAGTPA